MKLREELLQIETDTPTMDELNALPYLDMVVRETLRLYSPVSSTIRVAKKDDTIPLNEPFTDRNGEVQDNIRWVPTSAIQVLRKLRLSPRSGSMLGVLSSSPSLPYTG